MLGNAVIEGIISLIAQFARRLPADVLKQHRGKTSESYEMCVDLFNYTDLDTYILALFHCSHESSFSTLDSSSRHIWLGLSASAFLTSVTAAMAPLHRWALRYLGLKCHFSVPLSFGTESHFIPNTQMTQHVL